MSRSPEDIFNDQFNLDEDIQDNIYMQRAKANAQVNQSQQLQQVQEYITYKILLKHDSKLNKKLIDFFKENLYELNTAGCKFEWIPVFDDEIEFYEEQDIYKFPVLILNETNNVIGVTNIIKRLNTVFGEPEPMQHRPAQKATNNQSKSNPSFIQNDEDLKEYLMNEIQPKGRDDDDDESDDVNKDISQRMASMFNQRKQMHQETPDMGDKVQNRNKKSVGFAPSSGNSQTTRANPASTNTMDIIKNNSKTLDDDVMEKYWANQEETEV